MADELTYARKVRSEQDMDELAATLAPLLCPRDVIMLNGDLGAGKTRFVQGVARALGVTDEVTSPTFTIGLGYGGGSLALNHFDLYRLDDADQLEDVGYWDALDADAASFVEWGDKFPHDLPHDFLEMRLTVDPQQVRHVTAETHGERSRNLLAQWANARDAHWTPRPNPAP